MVKTKEIGTLCHKKQTKLWALIALLGLFLALSVSLEARGSSNSDETKTIRYGIWDDSFQPVLKEIIAAFEQENLGVQVDLQVVPWADYWPKLQTSLSAGTAWDVFWINAPYFPVYESYGVISDLSDEYRKAGVDLDKFPKALVEMYQVDGRPYTLPWFFDTLVFYYNKARFDEAGLKYPNADWTLDDVQAAAEQLRNKEAKQWGIYLNTYSQSIWGILLSNGGQIFTEDRMGLAYTQPKSLEVWQKFYRLFEQDLSPAPSVIKAGGGTSAVHSMLASGMIAMVNDGSWSYNPLRKQMDENLGVSLLPAAKAGQKSATILHGLGHVAYTKSKHLDAAKKLALYMTSPKAQEILARANSVIPAYQTATALWVESFAYPEAGAILSNTQGAYPYQIAKPGGLEWDTRATEILEDTFNGNIPFAEGMQRAVEEADRIIQGN